MEIEDIGPGDLQESDGYQTIYHQQLGPRSLAQCHLFQPYEPPDAYPWEAWWNRQIHCECDQMERIKRPSAVKGNGSGSSGKRH